MRDTHAQRNRSIGRSRGLAWRRVYTFSWCRSIVFSICNATLERKHVNKNVHNVRNNVVMA